MSEDELLGTADAAKRLGVSARRVRQYIDDGRLPARRVGRGYVLRAADLDDLERQHRLTEDQVREIKRRLAAGEPQAGIARDYDVTRGAIAAIDSGQNWGHVTIDEKCSDI